MANKPMNARVQLKNDTENNWGKAVGFKPKAGEAIVYNVDASHSAPRLKFGNGTDIAADLPFVDAGTVNGHTVGIDVPPDAVFTDTQLITGVKGNAESSYRTGNVNITKANIGLGNVDNTSDADKPVSTAMQTALNKKVDAVSGKGLSTNDYTTAEKNKLDAIADGAEVNVQSDWNTTDSTSGAFIKNKPTLGAAAAKAIVTAIDTSASLPTANAVKSYVDTAVSGLSGAMHFIGSKTAVPTSGTYAAGDVILVDKKEYVYDGSAWAELGDEGSYALKSVTITAGDGLTGGGSLAANRTISHADKPASTVTAASTVGSATARNYIKQIKLDKHGHIIDVVTGAETVSDTNTTYTFESGTNGFKVTPSGGSAQAVTVTPSIANNITGSGTKDYLAKFTSANTIGAGPQIDTSIAAGSTSTNVPTSKAVADLVATKCSAPLIITTTNTSASDALTYGTATTLTNGQLVFLFLKSATAGTANMTLKLGGNAAINLYLTSTAQLKAAFAANSVLGFLYNEGKLYMINPPVAI